MKLIYPSFPWRQNPQTVLKNSLSAIVFVVLLSAITLPILVRMPQQHWVLLLALIYTIATGLYLLTAPQRQTQTGSLLLQLPLPPSHQQQSLQAIWGLLLILTVTLLLVSLYACFNIAMEPINAFLFESILTILFFLWMQGFYWLLTGMSQPEFRHRGIWIDLHRISWQQIKAYSWKRSKTNQFKLDLKFRSFGLPQRLTLYPISAPERQTIDRIFQQKFKFSPSDSRATTLKKSKAVTAPSTKQSPTTKQTKTKVQI